jgi:formylglycine-generating enzyme required for sulfatase activity
VTPVENDRTPTHVQLLHFRATSWQKAPATADIAVALGLASKVEADADPRAAVSKLRDCVDEALEQIRVREIDDPPEFDRSLFFAGALLLRRAELLGPDDEALLRGKGLGNKPLQKLSASGIEARRDAIADKWRKEHGEGQILPSYFKTHLEKDVFAALAQELDLLLASRRPAEPPKPDDDPKPQRQRRPRRDAAAPGEDPAADYTRSLAQHLQSLYTAHAPTRGRAALSLDQSFVELPVDVAITAEVEAGRVRRWALMRVDPDSDEYRTARVEAFDVDVTDTLSEVAADLVDQLDAELASGVESEYVEGLGRPAILAKPFADGIKWNVRPLLVEDVARAHRFLLLLGAPGSGKSTVARHMALTMCDGTSLATATDDTGSVPIYASLRDVAASPTFKEWPEIGALPRLWAHVADDLDLSDATQSALAARVSEGRALVILDGLDEVPRPRRVEDAEALDDLLERFVLSIAESAQFLLVTSRPPGASRWPLEPLVRYHLAPLRAPERARLAQRLLKAGSVGGFMHALQSVPRSLKDRPLFVQLMTAMYAQSTGREGDASARLPQRRSRLYRESIKLLLDRWTRPQDMGRSIADRLGCTLEELYLRLAVIAYETQATAVTTTDVDDIPLPVLLTQLVKLEGDPDIRAVLSYLSQEAGVLVSPARDSYEFAHKGFQEFLAAAFLVAQEDGARTACEHIADDIDRWRESCLMLGEALIEDGTRGDLWAYVEELLAGARESFGPLWLAARLVRDETDPTDRAKVRNAPLVDMLRVAITNELAAQRASPVIDRFDLGSALEDIGDTRPGVGVKDGLPDIAWCRVPGGESLVGSSPRQAKTILKQDWASGWSLDRETPCSTRAIRELLVGRYPVTVAQFRAFLDADDGYDSDEWWSAAGLCARGENEPQHPLQSLDVGGNLPATFVSWYDATAFCRWTSARLGKGVRLPREDEWERIARGPASTIFPWGNDFDHAACNSQAANVGTVMSAGFCPTGVAPWDADGVHDMCGNVWEWTSTAWENGPDAVYAYPYRPDDGREAHELAPGARRVVRGGSYLNGAFLCRAAYRGRDNPAARLGRQGFRVVGDLD